MVGMISRRWFITRMRAGGVAFNLPMFKRKKSKHGRRPNKKKKVSSSRYNGNGSLKNTSRGQGITTTTPVTSPSPHYPPFPSIGRCTSTHISNPISSRYNDDDWLVFELLNKLPVKSLTRFKSVCKRWCYLIQKDQQFIDLHLTRSRTRLPSRLLIVVPLPRTQAQEQTLERLRGTLYFENWPFKEFHITADLLFEEDNTKLKLVVDTVREVDSSSYNVISKPVKGLICLIQSDGENVVRIRNISTGEVSPWFQLSSILVGEECVTFPNLYAFGFDPATNEHKLVCVLTISSNFHNSDSFPVCGVSTIGHQCNNRWRRIKEVPPKRLNYDYVYVNGVIYWSNSSLDIWASRSGYRPVYLVAFDVGNEKFRTITIPDFILDHPRILDKRYFKDIASLFEVDGNLAMIVKLNNCMFNMYVYENDDYKDKDDKINETSSSSCLKSGRWNEVSCIKLPFCNGQGHSVKFHTFIGSEDKILVTSSIWGLETEKCLFIYCYNWKKDTWTEVDVSDIPSSVPQLCPRSFATTFSESLYSLNNLNAL